MDLGFTYQWHPKRTNDSIPIYKDAYKLKVGLSVTDIGSIKYKDSELNSYVVTTSQLASDQKYIYKIDTIERR